jgi:hypothetical protein
VANSLKSYLSQPEAALPPQISVEEVIEEIVRLHKADGGATFSLFFGSQAGEPLWAVSPYESQTRRFRGREIARNRLLTFIRANRDLLQNPSHCIGTWYNEEDGFTYLDISLVESDPEQALALAVEHDQIAVFDLKVGEVIEIGGTGGFGEGNG